MPVSGVGSLIVQDILTDVSYTLIEPCVNTTAPAGGFAAGVQTVAAWDPSMYVGAQILVGILGYNVEVVTITATVPGTSFTATFTNSHLAGDPIFGPTFPVQNTAGDPFFTQTEMLGYISNAVNDYLTRCPIVYAIGNVSMTGGNRIGALPADCMTPMRVAYNGSSLRESSQSWIDSVTPTWSQSGTGTPQTYYRDKVGLGNIGIYPAPVANLSLETVYQQRSAQLMGLADGFLLPDVFTPYIKARVLSFAYSKGGEQKSPAMAKYWGSRFETGVKIGLVLQGIIEDTNLQ